MLDIVLASGDWYDLRDLGNTVADAIVILGSVDIVVGEVDR